MIIRSEKTRRGYINAITEYLDRYLIGKTDRYYNYIEDNFTKDEIFRGTFTCGIRTPGATRGSLVVKSGIIENIELFEDRFCYSREVLDNLNQFIGKAIDLPLDEHEKKCLKVKLHCCKDFEFKIDGFVKEPTIIKKGDIVNFEITDLGVRFEYEPTLYSDLIPPSSIYEYFTEIKE